MTRTHVLLLFPLAAALVGAATACGSDDDDPSGARERREPAVLRVVATTGDHEYRFEVPAEIAAGATRIALDNEGDEPHHAQLFRLNGGSTVGDLSQAIATGGPPAALAHGEYMGGTSVVAPGSESRADAVVDLEPGEYAFLCLVPDAGGTAHLAHGMVHPVTVRADGERAESPAADVAVDLVDYHFELPDELDRGAVLELTDRSAAEPHEMAIARLDEGADVRDVLAALHAGEPMPATPLGGMQAILPGATQKLQLDLEPGRYVVMCAVPSPDGVPHHDKGMIREVTVR